MKNWSNGVAVGLLGGGLLLGCGAVVPQRVQVESPGGPVAAEWTPEELAQPRAGRPVFKSDTASYLRVRLAADEALHRHNKSDVVTVLLSGKVRMQLGDRTVEMLPGDVVLIPRGTPHSVTKLSQEAPEALLISSPAADPTDREELSTP